MAQYINKDALVAEIKKIIPSEPYPRTYETLYGAETYGKRGMCFRILDLINTLEVKEVDLEKELSLEDYKSFFEKHPDLSDDWGFDEAWMFAKHFFELGLKAQEL